MLLQEPGQTPPGWIFVAALAAGLGVVAAAQGAGRAKPLASNRSQAVAADNARANETPRADRPVRLVSGSKSAAVPPDDEDSLFDDRATSIDLSTALRLAGVENLELVVARQRVEAAVALQQ